MGDVADEIKSSCARSNLLVHRGERPEQRRGFAAARAARQGRSRWRWLIAGALCYAAPLLTALRAAGGSEAGNAGAARMPPAPTRSGHLLQACRAAEAEPSAQRSYVGLGCGA